VYHRYVLNDENVVGDDLKVKDDDQQDDLNTMDEVVVVENVLLEVAEDDDVRDDEEKQMVLIVMMIIEAKYKIKIFFWIIYRNIYRFRCMSKWCWCPIWAMLIVG